MKSKVRRRTNQRNQFLLEAPALSRHFVHFVTEIPPDMQPDAPPRRDCGSLPLLPPACPAWRNAGGGPPALNYSVTNILCTFPHQPCHLPRPDRDAALPIHYPSISTIHTKQYLDQSTLLISKLGCLQCVIQRLLRRVPKTFLLNLSANVNPPNTLISPRKRYSPNP